MIRKSYFVVTFWVIVGFCLLTPRSSFAQERLCDPSFEDCYTPLLQLINSETVGIDMSFYMIELPDMAEGAHHALAPSTAPMTAAVTSAVRAVPPRSGV